MGTDERSDDKDGKRGMKRLNVCKNYSWKRSSERSDRRAAKAFWPG